MRVRRFEDPVRFAAHVTPLLLEREAENNLMLGLTSAVAAGPRPTDALLYAAEDGEGRAVAAMVMAPGRPLVLTAAPDAAVAPLVQLLGADGVRPPAVSGPDATATAFAGAWAAETGLAHWTKARLGLYRLTEVLPPPRPAEGTFRAAEPRDVDFASEWAEAFFAETGHIGQDDPRQVVECRVREERLFFWCEAGGRPACMAGWAGKTPNGVRVNFVYTPPEHRKRGYATSCVAALTRRLLDAGSRFCVLFTDLARPTPNDIYPAIGYRHLCDFRDLRFEPRRDPTMIGPL